MTSVQEEIMSGNVAKIVNRLSKDLSFGRNSDVAFRRPGSGVRLANVRFSYKAAHDDELDLEVDDVIEVIEDAETGWMKGKIRSSGRVGLFPTNFVHFVEPQSSGGNGVMKVSDAKKKTSDVGADDSPEALQRTSVIESLKPKLPGVLPFADSKKTDLEGAGDASTKEMARVLFTYSPAHEDELALREVGAMVTIISKTCPDPGWYLGELDGKRGLIPDNFVEIVRLPASSTTESHKNMPASTVSVVPPPVVPTKPSKPPGLGISSTSSIRRVGSNAFAATLADALTKPPKTFVSKAARFEESSTDGRGDERLSHITATRPRQPNKRPPSTIFSKRKSTDNLLDVAVPEEVNSTPILNASASEPTTATAQLSIVSVPSPKQQSPKSVSDSEFVTRAEYNRLQARIDELHAEMIQRIAALEAKLAKQGTI
uniref:SH3 domain-containing kinase-binding protein 1 n=1 Tax=Ascaris suum TaxID=6253 RepID=F1L662_ASCSU